MSETSSDGAPKRAKKPAGYYSKAAREQRQAAHALRRTYREQLLADRAQTLREVEAATAPMRTYARRQLDALPERAPLRLPKRRPGRKAPNQVTSMMKARAAANRAAWALRHPAAAAAERSLKRDRKDLLERWSHKNDGTPETHEHASRINQGALARLVASGAIDIHQLAAAEEIRKTVDELVAGVSVRTASLETRVDSSRTAGRTFFEKLGQVRREVAYTAWRAELAAPAPVLEMIVGDAPGDDPVPFTIVAKRYRMHNRRAKRLLIAALDRWPLLLAQACREIDEATLLAAQAGIL